MSSTTVGEFALELKKTPATLIEQFLLAGIKKNDVKDAVTDADKQKLLQYLQSTHLGASGERKKITFVKKSTTEIKRADSSGKARTIEVEVRKKRTFIQRDEDTPKVEKLRIERIQAKAFKAFRDFDFHLQGRNLLVYGSNGAGKSSLYWLLYTFLQSGKKSFEEVAEYFDPNSSAKSLLNVHATSEEHQQAHITLTLKSNDQTQIAYPISASNHHTKDRPEIAKVDLASDFVTYRTLFNFYNFRHRDKVDLWPIFATEILPFVNTTNAAEPNLGSAWQAIQVEYANVLRTKKTERSKKAVEYDEHAEKFNIYLDEALNGITRRAQKFYDKHFCKGDVAKLTLLLGLSQGTQQFDADVEQPVPPRINFEIKLGEKVVPRPHTFFNEAKLTQLALSIRFGATLVNLNESPLKLLVLDDLLISLDMNNRIPVVDIILGEDFKEYQKIILTHDIGFFKEFRRRIGQAHGSWFYRRFNGRADTIISLEEEKSDIEKAQQYLERKKLDEAANCLRKAAEEMAAHLRVGYANTPISIGEFQTLGKNLIIAKNKLHSQVPHQLCDRMHERFGGGEFDQKAFDALKTLIAPNEWLAFESVKIIDDVLKATDRVLNPGSHGGDAPLFESEVSEALELIEKFLANGNALLEMKNP